jgi:hypothetical protein
MSYKSIVNDNIQNGLVKRIADDILQGIEKVYEKKEISSRRWIWELLQNAKDIPNEFGNVRIKITLNKDQLIFSHNGDPFTIRNLTNLIMQVSSKFEDEEDDVTGKFGTGFLVTHLLSKKLTVKGIVSENAEIPKRFEISMDREAENVKELIPKLKTALSKIEEIDTDPSFQSAPLYYDDRTEKDFDTSFIYTLHDERSLKCASNGINDLVNTLPLTLLFVNKINEVLVEDNVNNNQLVFKLQRSALANGDLNTVNIVSRSNLAENKELYFWTLSDKSNKVDCALQVTSPTDFSPVEWNKNTPKLYRDFPLIGSEKFYLPIVVNGHNFYPNEARSGLLIADEESVKVQENKRLLLVGIELIKNLIENLPSQVRNRMYLLALNRTPSDVPENWYKEKVQRPFRGFLLDQPIVASNFGLKKLRESKFPKATESKETNELFYDVVAPYLGADILPFRAELGDWLKIINKDYNDWNCDLKFEVKDLIERIEGENLSEIQLKDDSTSTIAWLNNFYDFLEKQDMRDKLDENAIVANREGDLKKLDELYLNDGIHDVFLDIYQEIAEDYSPYLVHSEIHIPFTGHQAITNKTIGGMINDELKDDDFEHREDRINIIHSLLKIFPSKENSVRRRIFNAFSDFFGLDNSDVIIHGVSEDFNFEPVLKRAIENLLADIESKKSVDVLSSHLNKSESDMLSWLNDLLQDVKDYLEDFTIIPTRIRTFGDLNELYVNDGIEDKFIEIYTELEEDYSPNLIHSAISLPLIGHQSMNNKDLGEMINEELKSASFERLSKQHEVILSLLCIYPSPETSFRKKIHQAFASYYGYKVDELIIPGIQNQFVFDPVIKRGLEALLYSISKDGNIDGLSSQLKREHDDSIIWLDNLLRDINESGDFRYFLDNYNIFPNQYETFMAKDELFNDGIEDNPLPTELLDILFAFDEEEDWRIKLLLDGIGVRVEESIKIVNLAAEIQKHAQVVFNAMTGEGANEKETSTLMNLVKWTTKNKLMAEEHFKWILEKKPLINTMRIENPAIQDAIYDLIDGDNEKIITLSKMAKIMSIDQLDDITKITNIIGVDSIAEISNLTQNFSEAGIRKLSEITSVIGSERLLSIAESELEKRYDFEFKKRIGDNVERVFKQAFVEMDSGLEISKREGRYDFLITNPKNNKEYYLELKSISSSLRYVKMAQSQAEFSSENNDKYALCVIRRPNNWNALDDSETPTDYIKERLKSLTSIGTIVKHAVTIAKDFQSKLMFGSNGDIGVEFRDSTFHYTVPESKWSNGSSFHQLVQHIKEELIEECTDSYYNGSSQREIA